MNTRNINYIIIIIYGFVISETKGIFFLHKYITRGRFQPLLSVALTWILCYIFTVTDYFPNDSDSKSYAARTDKNTDVIDKADWLYIPYPGYYYYYYHLHSSIYSRLLNCLY